MTEEAIIKIALDEAFYVHKRIGLGMLESVYKTCLAYRLQKRGLLLEMEKPVPVFFEEVKKWTVGIVGSKACCMINLFLH